MKHRKVFHWPRFHIKFTEGLFLHLNSFAHFKAKLQSVCSNTKGEATLPSRLRLLDLLDYDCE